MNSKKNILLAILAISLICFASSLELKLQVADSADITLADKEPLYTSEESDNTEEQKIEIIIPADYGDNDTLYYADDRYDLIIIHH